MTDVYAILGWPVAHSRSPAMHNAAFAALGRDARYVPLAIPPDKLGAALEAIRAQNIAGFNVTLPHKTAIMPLLDDVAEGARAIGAVNTVLREGQRLLGSNTDAEGLVRSLQAEAVELRAANVLVLGAGGAARAAVVGLAAAGVGQICVAARREDQAATLVRELSPHAGTARLVASGFGATLASACEETSVLIQATSATLGEQGEAFSQALPLHALPKSAVVCDLVYKPRETAVLLRAQTLGLRTVDGFGMLLYQGALAFERFTGEDAPIAIMRQALDR